MLLPIILFLFYNSVDCFLHPYPKITLRDYVDGDDVGDILYLTPYLERGDIDTARKLASVPSDQWLGVESYSGFFTVDKHINSNHFFWYFPSMTNATEAPVILWLNGGPGASSLFGAFQENGPISVYEGKIRKREITWATNHHIIYVDNPVGTGFSFTISEEGFCTNEEQIGAQLYSTMTQFFQLFPELQKNEFYVVGESYGGKYAPALAYTIHVKNPEAKLKINLKGIAIGDGWCDPIHQLKYDNYLYQLGLIDGDQKKEFQTIRKIAENSIRLENWQEAYNYTTELFTLMLEATGISTYYNYVLVEKDMKEWDKESFQILFSQAAVRKSLHVGTIPFGKFRLDVYNNLTADFAQSIAPWLSELLKHYRVLFYNGELDLIVGYTLTVNFLNHLNFSGSDEYKNAKRNYWYLNEYGDLIGWYKQGGNLTEMMIKNAGHMVPHDQPEWAWAMITHFTHNTKFEQNTGGKNIFNIPLFLNEDENLGINVKNIKSISNDFK